MVQILVVCRFDSAGSVIVVPTFTPVQGIADRQCPGTRVAAAHPFQVFIEPLGREGQLGSACTVPSPLVIERVEFALGPNGELIGLCGAFHDPLSVVVSLEGCL